MLRISRLLKLCPLAVVLFAGAAMAAAVANLLGFAHGFSEPAARAAGVWVFLSVLPIAGLACLTAWRVGSLRATAVVE